MTDTCTGSVDLSLDLTGDPQVTGTGNCTWAGAAAAFWPEVHLGSIDGVLSDTSEVSGSIVVTGAEVGTMESPWAGSFDDGVLIAAFSTTLDLEYEGVTYPVEVDGSFTATHVSK